MRVAGAAGMRARCASRQRRRFPRRGWAAAGRVRVQPEAKIGCASRAIVFSSMVAPPLHTPHGSSRRRCNPEGLRNESWRLLSRALLRCALGGMTRSLRAGALSAVLSGRRCIAVWLARRVRENRVRLVWLLCH